MHAGAYRKAMKYIGEAIWGKLALLLLLLNLVCELTGDICTQNTLRKNVCCQGSNEVTKRYYQTRRRDPLRDLKSKKKNRS